MSGLPSNFFVDAAAVREIEVKFPNGTAHKMFFKDISQSDWDAYTASLSSSDEAVRKSARAKLIATSVCDPDGTLSLTPEKAAELKPSFAIVISNAVMKANEFSAAEGKG